jgi:hypothetical protein
VSLVTSPDDEGTPCLGLSCPPSYPASNRDKDQHAAALSTSEPPAVSACSLDARLLYAAWQPLADGGVPVLHCYQPCVRGTESAQQLFQKRRRIPMPVARLAQILVTSFTFYRVSKTPQHAKLKVSPCKITWPSTLTLLRPRRAKYAAVTADLHSMVKTHRSIHSR